MKEGIHPEYVSATISCACGNVIQTRSTRPTIKLEICSNCHPFFTGQQKLVDSAGRVERFENRFAKTSGETVKKETAEKKAKGQKLVNPKKTLAKIMSTTPIKIPVKAGKGGKPEAGAKAAGKPAEKAAEAKAK